MKHNQLYAYVAAALLSTSAIIVTSPSAQAQASVPQTTAFTYQGQLQDSGGLVNGSKTFVFTLLDGNTAVSGMGITNPVIVTAQVTDGLFTANVDFGLVFGNTQYNLQVAVQDGSNTDVIGTQPINTVPVAQYALSSGNGVGPTGPQGPPGDAGPTGPAGDVGPPGSAGAVGPAGPAGAVGPPGATGAAGTKGATGATGTAGTNGTNGTNGATGATGAAGTKGATGATGATGSIAASVSYQTSATTTTCSKQGYCSITTTCPAGKYAIGGGSSVTGGTSAAVYLDITENYPTMTGTSTINNAWTISGFNFYSGYGTKDIVVTGYAICAN